MINYFSSGLAKNDFSYHTINSNKAAIVQTLSLCNYNAMAQNATIIRFMKGVYLAKKPKPKYIST